MGPNAFQLAQSVLAKPQAQPPAMSPMVSSLAKRDPALAQSMAPFIQDYEKAASDLDTHLQSGPAYEQNLSQEAEKKYDNAFLEEAYNEKQKEFDTINKEIENHTYDKERMFSGAPAKIMAALAVALGGPNAYNAIMNFVNQDLEVQKAELEDKKFISGQRKNELGIIRQHINDKDEQKEAFIARGLSLFQRQLQNLNSRGMLAKNGIELADKIGATINDIDEKAFNRTVKEKQLANERLSINNTKAYHDRMLDIEEGKATAETNAKQAIADKAAREGMIAPGVQIFSSDESQKTKGYNINSALIDMQSGIATMRAALDEAKKSPIGISKTANAQFAMGRKKFIDGFSVADQQGNVTGDELKFWNDVIPTEDVVSAVGVAPWAHAKAEKLVDSMQNQVIQDQRNFVTKFHLRNPKTGDFYSPKDASWIFPAQVPVKPTAEDARKAAGWNP